MLPLKLIPSVVAGEQEATATHGHRSASSGGSGGASTSPTVAGSVKLLLNSVYNFFI